ncbi:hypothetical protein DFH11DRAFT_1465704, partial [Phellopilus nigrolimitatus]
VSPPLSRNYPDLHPILAQDTTTLLYDVRRMPRDEIPCTQYIAARKWSAMRNPATYMRIISSFFPWPIEIQINEGLNGVRVLDIWKALYDAMQRPIREEEWAMLVQLGTVTGSAEDETSQQMRILRAVKRREVKGGSRTVHRVDWLGSRTKFCGLYKDRSLEGKLKLPAEVASAETWVADFT